MQAGVVMRNKESTLPGLNLEFEVLPGKKIMRQKIWNVLSSGMNYFICVGGGTKKGGTKYFVTYH